MEQIVGRIEFGNTREGVALSTLSEAVMERTMWMQEAMRKDEEISILRCEVERLKKLLKSRRSKNVRG